MMAPTSPAVGRGRAINVEQSKITVHVSKHGMFGFLGDDHDIETPLSSGSYDSNSQTVDIAVDAAKLRVLDPSDYSASGENRRTALLGLGHDPPDGLRNHTDSRCRRHDFRRRRAVNVEFNIVLTP
jgi:hypothetical protein